MNLQSHHSGQIGQVPNQAGAPFSGLQQQNGNVMLGQIQNPSVPRVVSNIDSDIFKMRQFMQDKIWQFLMQRRKPAGDVSKQKMFKLVKKLEEGLLRNAKTTEEYLNLATLEKRLLGMIRGTPVSNQNQQFQNANPPPSMGTMMPTPGLQNSGNLSIIGTSSVDGSLANNNSSSSTLYSGNFVPRGNGSSRTMDLSTSDGLLAGLYQQSSAFSVNSGGNNMVTSMDQRRVTGHMIPTPGFSSSNNSDMLTVAKNIDSRLDKKAQSSVEFDSKLKEEKKLREKLQAGYTEKDKTLQEMSKEMARLKEEKAALEQKYSTVESKNQEMVARVGQLAKEKEGFETALRKTREELFKKGKYFRVEAVRDFQASGSCEYLLSKREADAMIKGRDKTIAQLKFGGKLASDFSIEGYVDLEKDEEMKDPVIEPSVGEDGKPISEEAMYEALQQEEFFSTIHPDEAPANAPQLSVPSWVHLLCELGNLDLLSAGINVSNLSYKDFDSLAQFFLGDESLSDTARSSPPDEEP